MAEVLEAEFETMPPQLQTAARFVLDHPMEVALMSMRELGRRVGVSHTTMARLAAWLGLDSYDELRTIYARAVRAHGRPWHNSGDPHGFAAEEGSSGFGRVANTLIAQVVSLDGAVSAKQLSAMADLLADSRRLFCFGPGSAQTVARHFALLMAQLGKPVAVLDPVSGTDAIHRAGLGDAMLAIGFAPHGQATSAFVQQMSRRGIAVAAITDSKMSPLARFARETIVVSTNSQSFFPTMAPALSVVEILAALTADRTGANVDEMRRREEQHVAATNPTPNGFCWGRLKRQG
ncbi:MAG: MurR/RpiR family transcriptional regulator [Ensifer alkalisoli]|nr:MurR/RpiR family transcriptional regulator [Sinorhizobium alkalisoli]